MFWIANIFLLLAAIKLLSINNKPLQVTALYVAAQILISLLSPTGLSDLFSLGGLFVIGVHFIFAFIFFTLLKKFEETFVYWVLIVLGFIAMFFGFI